ncbi:MAG: hypothetical protein DRO13_05100 [Thermoprotei archaeon]|nr:MAG: hypothetical protein DRO13_05100 [Thermoprotei archaeon]
MHRNLQHTFHVPPLALQKRYFEDQDLAIVYHPYSHSLFEIDRRSALMLKLIEMNTPIPKVSELTGIPINDIKRNLDCFYSYIENLKPREIIDFAKPSVIWVLNCLRCNLRCRYCYTLGGEAIDSYLNVQDSDKKVEYFIKAIDKLHDVFGDSVRNVDIFGGGEPLVDFESVKKIIDHIDREGYGYKLAMITNGTLLDKEKAEYLKAHNVRLTLSIDGPRVVNDLNRVKKNGQGIFDDLMKAIKILKDLDYEFDIQTTYTREAYELGYTPKDLVEYLSTLSRYIIIQPAQEMLSLGTGSDNLSTMHLFVEYLDAVFRELTKPKPRFYDMIATVELGLFGRKAIKGVLCPFPSFLTILPGGKIISCHTLPHYVIGDVRELHSPRDLIARVEQLNGINRKLTELIDNRYRWLVSLQDICPAQIFKGIKEILFHIQHSKPFIPRYLDYAGIFWDAFILNVYKYSRDGLLQRIYDNVAQLAQKRRLEGVH